MNNHEVLAAELLGRIRQTGSGDDMDAALQAITNAVVELGIADHAGITERVGDSAFETHAATDELVMAADGLQYQFDQGPCVQATYDNELLVSGDIAADPRWPQWGPRAATRGIGAVISANLYTTDAAMGALNLYFADRKEYVSEDLELARLVGAHTSIVLAHYRRDANLWKAIDARHRIGQAQGILMERFDITAEQAFALLRRLSQDQNTKIRLVADTVVTTRKLPTSDTENEKN